MFDDGTEDDDPTWDDFYTVNALYDEEFKALHTEMIKLHSKWVKDLARNFSPEFLGFADSTGVDELGNLYSLENAIDEMAGVEGLSEELPDLKIITPNGNGFL